MQLPNGLIVRFRRRFFDDLLQRKYLSLIKCTNFNAKREKGGKDQTKWTRWGGPLTVVFWTGFIPISFSILRLRLACHSGFILDTFGFTSGLVWGLGILWRRTARGDTHPVGQPPGLAQSASRVITTIYVVFF